MKKGMVLINVIITMIMLNILILSTFMINKNIAKSKALSIKAKEEEIYFDSKINIVDYAIFKLFENSIHSLKSDFDMNMVTEETATEKLKAYMRNNLQRNLNLNNIDDEIYLDIPDTILSKDNKYKFELMYRDGSYKDKKIQYIEYTLKMPELIKEDIDELKIGNINTVYEKYKNNLIEKKIVY